MIRPCLERQILAHIPKDPIDLESSQVPSHPIKLLSHQLKRLARRVPMGIARTGGMGANGSGDIFIAFSTANPGAAQRMEIAKLEMLPNDLMTPLLEAVVYATEEAIVNALVAAETMIGINGNTVHALPHDRLKEALSKFNRLVE